MILSCLQNRPLTIRTSIATIRRSWWKTYSHTTVANKLTRMWSKHWQTSMQSSTQNSNKTPIIRRVTTGIWESQSKNMRTPSLPGSTWTCADQESLWMWVMSPSTLRRSPIMSSTPWWMSSTIGSTQRDETWRLKRTQLVAQFSPPARCLTT